MNDNKYLGDFKKTIEELVDNRIQKHGITHYIAAKITSINEDGTINAYILPDETKTVSNLLNKTGELLSVNDSIEICTKNGKLNNAWVALKHGTNVVGSTGAVPSGGISGQVLAKNSNTDYDLKWINASGSGDMLKSTYDPSNKNANAFDMTNMIEGTVNKIFTATERTKLLGIADGAEANVNADWNAISGDAQILNKPTIPTQLSQLTDDSTHRLVTDTEKSAFHSHSNKTALDLVSGTNSGDETTTTIKTKLGVANTTTDGYLTKEDWNTFNSKQETLVSGTNIKTVNGNSLLGSGDIVITGGQTVTDITVATANTTVAKIGTTVGGTYTPNLGDIIRVNFTLGCNVSSPTLNIDGSGAKNIRLGNSNVTTSYIGTTSALTILMWYDGTYYQIYGSLRNDNTTYSEITTAEIDAGTSTTLRSISGRRAQYIVDKARLGKQDTLVDGVNIKTINGISILGTENILLQTPLTIATGTDINTGTDDAKYITAKAIKDSNLINSTNGTVTDIQELTTAEYEALSQAEKDNGTYFITDDMDGAINVVNGFTSTSITDPGSAYNDKLLNDKINTFSASEIEIGKWIDGKVLYSKSFTISIGTATSSSTAFNVTGYDTIFIDTGHTFFKTAQGYVIPLGHYGSATDWSRVFIPTSTNTVDTVFGSAYSSVGKTAYVTINYTKV